MFEKKKKKEYSEVSETGLNINSDYFKILHKEFKSLFVEKNTDSDTDNNDDINNNCETSIKLDNVQNNEIDLDNKDIFYIGLFSKYISNNQTIK